MSTICRAGLFALLFCVMATLAERAVAAESPSELHPWEVFEVEMTAERELTSPYVEGLPESGPAYVTVTFRRESGEARGQELRVTGFWDGAQTWRVRFAPPATGEWSYRSSSRDPGLDGKTGRFRCDEWTDAELAENATRRGFVRVCDNGPRPGRSGDPGEGTGAPDAGRAAALTLCRRRVALR